MLSLFQIYLCLAVFKNSILTHFSEVNLSGHKIFMTVTRLQFVLLEQHIYFTAQNKVKMKKHLVYRCLSHTLPDNTEYDHKIIDKRDVIKVIKEDN